MREQLLACALAVLTAVTAFPQTDEWQLRMEEGSAAEDSGDYAKAAALYRAAAEVAERFDQADRRRAVAWNFVSIMYDALGRFADAEAGYRRALKAAAASTGKSGPEYALVLGNLGTMYVEIGQPATGEKFLREALAIYSAADPPNEMQVAITRNGLAEAISASGKHKEAERLLTLALPVLEKNPKAWGQTAIATNNLGVARFFQGNNDDARRLLLRALDIVEQHMGTDHPMLVRTLNNLASLAARTGHREEAGERLRRGLDIAERRLGPEHPVYAALLANYAELLRLGGDKSQAKVLAARSSEILKDSSRRNGIGAVIDIHSLRQK
jgi:tetratricopeptide (TPR) repeat protein